MSDFKFLCPECGQKILCDSSLSGAQITCPGCQKTITIPSAPAAAPTPAIAAAALAPVAAGGVAAATAAPPPPRRAAPPLTQPLPRPAPAPAAEKTRHSALAIASLLCSVFIPLGFIPGLICGHMAKERLRKNVFLDGETLANAGLAISYSVLAALVLCGIAFLGVQWHFHPVRTVRSAMDAAAAPEYRIVDAIVIGENEDDHGLSGQIGRPPAGGKIKGRKATQGGAFSYTMKVLPDIPMTLNCRYSGDEAKGRIFDIAIDDEIIATQTLNHDLPGKVFDEEYKIPTALTRGKTEVTVEFQARPNMVAGTLYGCQILKP